MNVDIVEAVNTGKRKYKILMIAPTSFFSDYGAHVRPLEEILILQAAGHKVTICTYHNGNDVAGINIKRSLNVPWKKGVQVGSSRHKLYFDAVLALKILQVGLKEKPDIIHAHLHEGALLGFMLKFLSRFKVPLVFDLQGSLTGEMVDHKFLKSGGLFYRYFRKLEYYINQTADKIITSSYNAAGVLKYDFGYPADKIVTIIDRVNSQKFRPHLSEAEKQATIQLKNELGIPLDRKVIVYLGLLAPYQGTNALLEAAKQLKEQGHNYHFVVMGYPGVDSYRELADYLGVTDRVVFPGRIPYEDAPRYLALGDVAVAPKMSTSESVGKIANYMAMGLPTVCFDTPTSREFLGDYGIYAKLGDVESLAQNLIAILENAPRRHFLAQKLRERAVKHFSWEQACREIEKIYTEVYAKTHPNEIVKPNIGVLTPAADSSVDQPVSVVKDLKSSKKVNLLSKTARDKALKWLRNSS
jgi:glycosyltransferase involved in cell wall biosynthesis